MLIYQNGGAGYFAVGVNDGRIYLEWKMENKIIEVNRRTGKDIILFLFINLDYNIKVLFHSGFLNKYS